MDFRQTAEEFRKKKIICVLRKIPEERLLDTAQALYEGGISFVEIPFDQRDEEQRKATARGISLLRAHFGGKLHVGAGTVCTLRQLEAAREAGAELIVAPNTDVEIIEKTKEYGLLSMPGAFTPSEMQSAHKHGADFIKLFPASGFTVQMVKEILVPLNHLELVFFGGVRAENLREILSAGVTGVGVASGIVSREAILAGDYRKLCALAKSYTEQL